MISTTQDWKDYVETSSVFSIKGVIEATDGTQISVTDDDFVLSSVVFSDAVSGTSTFDVGSVITNTFKATLVNNNDKFTGFDFEGASFYPYVGISDLNEYYPKAKYYFTKPQTIGRTIDIIGYDKMDKLNIPYIGKSLDAYGDVYNISFPITSKNLVEAIMRWVGWTYEINTFWELGDPLTIKKFEYNESTTCRQVLNWIMQLEGGFARINNYDALRCRWYGASPNWGVSDTLEGGTISPWSGADTEDGGTIDPWNTTTDVSGGDLTDWFIDTTRISQSTISSEDIQITGASAYEDDTVESYKYSTVGTIEYVIGIKNPLVKPVGTYNVARHLYSRIGGTKFRPFEASIFGDPSIEAGDTIAIADYKGVLHYSVITNSTFTMGGFQRIGCYAESQKDKATVFASDKTSTVQNSVLAAYDYLQAKTISADYISSGTLGVNGTISAQALNILGGEMAGLTIDENSLYSSYTYPHTYTNSDATRIQNIITGGITPTTEDYELYDFTGDGSITTLDYIFCNKIINDNGGVLTLYVEIDPENKNSLIKAGATNINDVRMTASGIYADTIGTKNLYLNGSLIGDYVESVGTSGSWYYRKWHSKRVECWYRASVSLACNTGWNGGYYGTTTVSNYPVTFSSAPMVQVSVEATNGNKWCTVAPGSGTKCGSIYVYSFASYSAQTTYINVYASGVTT